MRVGYLVEGCGSGVSIGDALLMARDGGCLRIVLKGKGSKTNTNACDSLSFTYGSQSGSQHHHASH